MGFDWVGFLEKSRLLTNVRIGKKYIYPCVCENLRLFLRGSETEEKNRGSAVCTDRSRGRQRETLEGGNGRVRGSRTHSQEESVCAGPKLSGWL